MAENSKTLLTVIGATKAGTTSLHAFLAGHPQIAMSPIKETHHFCPDLWPFMGHVPRLSRTELERLVAQKESLHCALIKDPADFKALYPGDSRHRYFGEASPSSLRSLEAPRLIHEADPNARLIVILRDPVQRALSHHRMERRDARVPESFERCIEEELTAASVGRRTPLGILESGCYGQALERLLGYFSRDQLLLLDFSLLQDRRTLAGHLGAFLGLESDRFSHALGHENQWGDARHAWLNRWLSRTGLKDTIRQLIPHRLIDAIKPLYYGKPQERPDVDPETERRLREFYREDLERLLSLTDPAPFPWIHRYRNLLS